MKITCPQDQLLSAVTIALRAVPVKTTMPILECLVLKVTPDQIQFLANDMEMGIETGVSGTIEEPGTVAVDAKVFSDIIRKLPSNDVTIVSDESCNISITCEKARFRILGKSAEEFPPIPEIERNRSIAMTQFTLKEMIRQTVFSIADNDSNRIMNGEYFEVSGDWLRMITLDGHRISIRKVQLKQSYEDIRVIVPGKTLNEISRIIAGDTEREVNLFFTDKHIVFEFDETLVISRLIEGNYYKVDQMLSKDYETKINVNKRDFLDCLDRAMLLVKESEKKPIILKIDDSGMELKINTSIGSMNEEMDIVKEGKDIMIGFNPRFLLDALRVIDEETITMYLFNPKAPCFIKDKDETYIYLILPVNFSGMG